MFDSLCQKLQMYGLETTQTVSLNETIALFLHTLAEGHSSRIVQERFQRSGEIVSRPFHCVLKALIHMSADYIVPCYPNQIHERVANMPFENAIVAIDGTRAMCCSNS